MCGFVGYVNGKLGILPDNETTLKLMSNRIAHRGPDSYGQYTNDHVSLGFRRLSIIDLSRQGNQPLYSEDERYSLVFNGEIYNFQELRQELKKLGYHFSSKTDSEVIIRGYEEYGEGIIPKLRGMFAFAIWDDQEEKLLLARDGFGIKPLYYTQHTTDGSFIFGSEIKAFMDHPRFIKSLNKIALKPYLTFQYNPLEETFFKEVYKLKPSHYMTVKDGVITQTKYWEQKFIPSKKVLPLKTYVSQIKETVQESVKMHEISDVQVGSFLSGGIDSSYITALLKPNLTYSIGFNQYEKMFNETDLAEQLSKQLGINNKRKFVSGDEAFDKMETIIYHLDEPDSNPSVVPLYFLAGLASKDVKVVLSGEGADEIFGGYEWYKPSKLNDYYRKIPLGLRQIAKRIIDPMHHNPRLDHFLTRGTLPIEQKFIGQAIVYTDQEALDMVTEPFSQSPSAIAICRPVYDEVSQQDELSKMQYLDMNVWLPGDILLKADKMSMAHSLELRVPFLDKEVMELAKTIPAKYRANYEETKYALREAALSVLPDEWANRKKVGFPVPIRHWLRKDPFYGKVKALFEMDLTKKFFDQDQLLHLLEDHLHKVADNGRKIWTAYVFLTWYQIYFIEDEGNCQTELV